MLHATLVPGQGLRQIVTYFINLICSPFLIVPVMWKCIRKLFYSCNNSRLENIFIFLKIFSLCKEFLQKFKVSKQNFLYMISLLHGEIQEIKWCSLITPLTEWLGTLFPGDGLENGETHHNVTMRSSGQSIIRGNGRLTRPPPWHGPPGTGTSQARGTENGVSLCQTWNGTEWYETCRGQVRFCDWKGYCTLAG